MLHTTLKKITALMLTVFMLFTVMPVTYSADASDFTDFPTGWSAEAVKAAVDNGLLVGRTANEIVPGGCLTRAEMATIINRAFGAKIEADIASYRDVSRSSWYYHEIAKAVNMQTFQGDGNALMRPDDCITREEVFTVIARAFVLESNDYSSLNKFGDANQIADWAKPYMSILTAKGYVNGDDLGNVNPKKNISREEFAQVMHNIVKTYYTHSGEFSTSGPDSSLIRTTGVTLKNVTINGDLVLGDGVGFGTVVLENVTIKGRLLARGGENAVKLVNTTVGEMVVVKDVNGVVNFHNYRSETPFKGIVEHTNATFIEQSGTIIHGGGSSGGSSGGRPSVPSVSYNKVTFKAEGMSDVVINIPTGSLISSNLPVAPAKEGYTFKGWYDENNRLVDANTVVNSDITATAVYTINKYTVTVNIDGVGTDREIEFGKPIGTLPSAPPKTGHTFDGWVDENGNAVTPDTIVKDNLNITAKYTPITYTVTFKADGVVTGTKSVVYNTQIGTLLTPPAKPGYTFNGWYIGTTKIDDTYLVASDIEVSAKYDEIPATIYKVTFKAEGIADFVVDVEEGLSVGVNNMPANPTKAGYKFVGWFDGDKEITADTPVTGNINATAKFEELIKYTVSFIADNSVISVITVNEGEPIGTQLPDDPTKADHVFAGWYDGTEKIDANKVVNSDIIAIARFIPQSIAFTITFKVEGNPDEIVNVAKGTILGTALPADPTKAGYTFDGWYIGNTKINPYQAVESNMEITARFTKIPVNTYTVTFVNEGSANIVITVEEGKTIGTQLPADPVKAGYVFDGWYDGSEKIDANKEVNSDIIAVARFTPESITYTLKFVVDGNPATIVTVDKGTVLGSVLPVAPSKPDYTFDGWYIGNAKIDPYQKVESDMEITARFTEITVPKYTVTFVNPGYPNQTVSIAEGSEIGSALPAGQPKEGYIFRGWFDDGREVKTTTVVNEDITAVAEYEIITYKVTFTTGGILPDYTMVVEHGKELLPLLPTAPAKPGYSFIGWYVGSNLVDATMLVKSDLTVKAEYVDSTVETHTVTFVTDVLPDFEINVEHGKTLGTLIPTAPAKPGYTFKGWFANGAEVNANTTVNGDMTIVAVYDAIPATIHKVVFKNDGESDREVNVEDGDAIGTRLPVAPSKEGYTFIGWFDNGREVTAATIVKENITAVAKYEKITYKVTFTTGGVLPDYTMVVEHGEALLSLLPTAPAKPGYSFTGWYVGSNLVDATMLVKSDLTVKAEYVDSTVETHTVTFVSGVLPDYVISVEHGKTLGTLIPTAPAKPGYTFKGWFANGAEVNANTTVNSDMTIVAVYDAISATIYKVVFKNDGESDIEVDVEEGNIIGTGFPAAPAKEGYTFDGWFDNGREVTAATIVKENIIAVAKYTKITYNVTFTTGGVLPDYTMVVEYGESLISILPQAPVKPGYKFIGWFLGSDVVDNTMLVKSDLTVEAIYEQVAYIVIFKAEGMDDVVVNVAEGDKIGTLPTAPDKIGFVFDAWYDQNGNVVTENTIPNESLTITAQYIERKYKVTFYDGIVAYDDLILHTVDEVAAGATVSDKEITKAIAVSEIPSTLIEYKDYRHEIKPQLVYKDASGNWALFDSTVAIKADTDVFYAFKNISANVKIKYTLNETLPFVVQYEDDTRAVDTVKDFLIYNRNLVDVALAKEDVYGQLIEKVASKSAGFLDNEGNIRKVAAKSWIIDIIKSIEFEGEIELYTEEMVTNGTYEKLIPVLEQAKDSSYIQSVCNGSYSFDKVSAYLDTIRGNADETKEFAMRLIGHVRENNVYQTFLKSFTGKELDVEINIDNVFYMEAIAYAVGHRHDYDSLKDRIKKSFGPIIDILGDEIGKAFLEDAQERYYNGAMAICNAIASDASYVGYFDTYLTFLINPIDHVARPLYDRARDKAFGKIISTNKYYYNENTDLQRLLNRDFDTVRDTFLVTGDVIDETYTGYRLNPNTYNTDGTIKTSGAMKYYDLVIDEIILADKAALWYKDNLTDEQLEALKSEMLADAARGLNKANEAVKAYDEDGVIPYINLKLDRLMNYNTFSKVYNKIDGLADKAIAKYKGTEFYNKVWTADLLEAKFPSIRDRMDIVFGTDDPVFNADDVFENETIWNKLGFNEFEYTGDEANDTLTLNALERIFGHDLVEDFVDNIKVRRYYQ